MTTTAVRPTAPPPAVLTRSRLPTVLRQSSTLAWRGVTKTMHSPRRCWTSPCSR